MTVEVEAITRSRLADWGNDCVRDHATPTLLVAIGHDDQSGVVHIYVLDDPLFDRNAIRNLLLNACEASMRLDQRLFRWCREHFGDWHVRCARCNPRVAMTPEELDAAVERKLWAMVPPWDPPAACADVADETLERCRQRVRVSSPHLSPAGIETVARQLAMANLLERAEFRQEFADACAWLTDVKEKDKHHG